MGSHTPPEGKDENVNMMYLAVQNLRDPSEGTSKPIGDMTVGSSTTGEQWASKKLNPGWNSTITMDGGGGSTDPTKDVKHPEYFVADLYLNNKKVANIDLTLQKGEAE